MRYFSVPAAPASSPPAISFAAVALTLAKDIKLAHSIFALPFALLAACMVWLDGQGQLRVTPAQLIGQFALVLACMVSARTWAMLVNRLADRRFDAANPRTRSRALASGRVSPRAGSWAAGISALAFCLACAGFWAFFANPWPLLLCLPVLAWIGGYSFTKRFTALCHLWLGISLAAAPLCAAVALDPASLSSSPSLWWLAGFVLCWVAGFDIVYALQDEGFDRRTGLSSIPAALGQRGAVWASRVLHLVALSCLLGAWWFEPRWSTIAGVGIIAVAALLAWEHALISRWVQTHHPRSQPGPHETHPTPSDDPPPALNMAFFTLNGVVSCVLGIAAGIDCLL